MAKKQSKKTKRKINKKGLIVLLLALYLIIMAFYYAYNMPVKNIIIKGNNMVSDTEIIEAAKISGNTKLFSLSQSKVIKNIKKNSLIEEVTVKKGLLGTVTIEVVEAKVLFYNVLNQAYTLSTGNEVASIPNSLGIPTLVNYVPSDYFAHLIARMSKVKTETLYLISEIEYNPDTRIDEVGDEVITGPERFLLRMNDGNYVYIDLVHFENINKYEQIYATIGAEEKGIFYLDTIDKDSNKVVFKTFDAINKDTAKDSDSNELSE